MATQLRRYSVADGGLDEVIAFFHEVRAVREQFGFTVEFAAADPVRSEFVWAVSHPDWDRAIRAYEASPERAALFADRSMPVEDRDLRMVDLIYGHAQDRRFEA